MMKNPTLPLKRHAGLIPLSREHHRGLLLAQLLKKNVPDYKGMPTTVKGKLQYLHNSYHIELLPHFEKEENYLLPLVARYAPSLQHINELIVREHRQLQNMVEHLLALTQPYKEEIVREQFNELGMFLEQHIRMEERMYFGRVQEVVPKDILDQLLLDSDVLPNFSEQDEQSGRGLE